MVTRSEHLYSAGNVRTEQSTASGGPHVGNEAPASKSKSSEYVHVSKLSRSSARRLNPPKMGHPLLSNIHLTSLSKIRANQNDRNLKALSDLYALRRLERLHSLKDGGVDRIIAWVNPDDGIIREFDEWPISECVVDEVWVGVEMDIVRNGKWFEIKRVSFDDLEPRLSDWFISMRGKRIPLPEYFHDFEGPKDTISIQNVYNRGQLQKLYDHPAIMEMEVDQSIVMYAFVEFSNGLIREIKDNLLDELPPRTGVLRFDVLRDNFGLWILEMDLSHLRSRMAPRLMDWFERKAQAAMSIYPRDFNPQQANSVRLEEEGGSERKERTTSVERPPTQAVTEVDAQVIPDMTEELGYNDRDTDVMVLSGAGVASAPLVTANGTILGLGARALLPGG